MQSHSETLARLHDELIEQTVRWRETVRMLEGLDSQRSIAIDVRALEEFAAACAGAPPAAARHGGRRA